VEITSLATTPEQAKFQKGILILRHLRGGDS